MFTSERLSPSLDDLEKSLQNVNAMLQSTPPKPVSFIFREFLYAFNKILYVFILQYYCFH